MEGGLKDGGGIYFVHTLKIQFTLAGTLPNYTLPLGGDSCVSFSINQSL